MHARSRKLTPDQSAGAELSPPTFGWLLPKSHAPGVREGPRPAVRRFFCSASAAQPPSKTAPWRSKSARAMAAKALKAPVELGGGIIESAIDIAVDALSLVTAKDVPTGMIDAETPTDRWFSPRTGWPKAPPSMEGRAWRPAPALMPTQAELPAHFPSDDKVIGYLSVEVLEAVDLPKLLQVGRQDAYCVLIYEGYAARTATIDNSLAPEWPVTEPRAFRFPITCPYAMLYVGVKDEDKALADDDVGRVTLELPSYHARTVYDSWYPLQYGYKKHKERYGSLRLRFSVVFARDAHRVVKYIQPIPTFVIPFVDTRARYNSAFAYRGKAGASRRRFRFSTFQRCTPHRSPLESPVQWPSATPRHSHLARISFDCPATATLCDAMRDRWLPCLSRGADTSPSTKQRTTTSWLS